MSLSSLSANIRNFIIKILYILKIYDEVHFIGGPSALPPPLSKDDEEKYLLMLEQHPKKAKQMLIEHNLRLVVYIAKKFENTGICVEDLISIGTIGLIKAINTFKPSKKIKLATYASRCVENEILMYLRKNTHRRSEISIDEPLNVDWDGNELLLSDILGTEGDIIYQSIESDVDRHLLIVAMERLSDREKSIMEMRFGIKSGIQKTQKEVAELMGISQSYISRLEKKIIGRLKRDISKMV